MFARFFGETVEEHKEVQLDNDLIKRLANLSTIVYDPWNSGIIPKDMITCGAAFTQEGRDPNDKSPIPNTDKTGFFGELLYTWNKRNSEATNLYIAIRGTVPSNIGNILGDIQVAFDKIPMQVDRAYHFLGNWMVDTKSGVERGTNYTFQKINSIPICITGHSLGSVIASCLFATLMRNEPNPNGRIKCIVYDNPGSYDIVHQYLQKYHGMSDHDATAHMEKIKGSILNIQSDVNIINTCNKQFGDVYRVKEYKLDGLKINPRESVEASYIANPHFLYSYSIEDQHSILHIRNRLDANIPLQKIDSPIGHAAAYNEYLDPVKRKDYWEAYSKYCWDHSKELRDSYKSIYEDFSKYFFETLKEMHKTSLSNLLDEEYVIIEKETSTNLTL